MNFQALKYILFAFFTLNLLSSISVQAYYPSYVLKLHNLRLDSKFKREISQSWRKFLIANPDILVNKENKYKSDQYCRVKFRVNDSNRMDLSSAELVKHKKHYEFNLAVFDFLRKYENRDFIAKDPGQPAEIEFKYLSF